MMRTIHLSTLKPEDATALLFDCMVEWMIGAEPKVPFGDHEGFFAEMLEAIRTGEPFDSAPWGTWGIILEDMALKGKSRMGAGVVSMFGHLGEIGRYGARVILIQHALVLLAHEQPRNELVVKFDIRKGKKKDRLLITPFGEGKLMLSGSLMLDDKVPTFDVAREYVEIVYG